jgi:hypothetical protein
MLPSRQLVVVVRPQVVEYQIKERWSEIEELQNPRSIRTGARVDFVVGREDAEKVPRDLAVELSLKLNRRETGDDVDSTGPQRYASQVCMRASTRPPNRHSASLAVVAPCPILCGAWGLLCCLAVVGVLT